MILKTWKSWSQVSVHHRIMLFTNKEQYNRLKICGVGKQNFDFGSQGEISYVITGFKAILQINVAKKAWITKRGPIQLSKQGLSAKEYFGYLRQTGNTIQHNFCCSCKNEAAEKMLEIYECTALANRSFELKGYVQNGEISFAQTMCQEPFKLEKILKEWVFKKVFETFFS